MKEGSRRQNVHINLSKRFFNPAIPTFESRQIEVSQCHEQGF